MAKTTTGDSRPKEKMLLGHSMEWRVNTPAFLAEVFNNNSQLAAMKIPANIFRELLIEVSERAAELNDPIMNALMCRLSLYGVADPNDKQNYNHAKLTAVLNHKEYLDYNERKWKAHRKAKKAQSNAGV